MITQTGKHAQDKKSTEGRSQFQMNNSQDGKLPVAGEKLHDPKKRLFVEREIRRDGRIRTKISVGGIWI